MKKIGVFLNSEPYIGGTFQYNQSILEALDSLDKNQYEIFALYKNEIWKSYLTKYHFKEKKLFYSRYLNIGSILLSQIARVINFKKDFLKKIYSKIDVVSYQIESLKLDLLICPSQDILPMRVQTPSIATIHDLMHRYEKYFPEVSDNGEYEKREFLYKNICKAAKAIFVDSEIGKKHVIDSYGRKYGEKVLVLPFAPPQYLLKKEINNEKIISGKYFFYPAQFWKHKNHVRLIEAIMILKQKKLDIKLILVGSKKNGYDDIISLIKKYKLSDNVKILGYVKDDEMISLYKNARAMIMPTFFGPTNIPPLEAFTLGCPVAVSNIYGMPEQTDGAALLFNPESVKDIADILLLLWNDDDICKKLIRKGYIRVCNFSQEKFNERFNEYIKHILTK